MMNKSTSMLISALLMAEERGIPGNLMMTERKRKPVRTKDESEENLRKAEEKRQRRQAKRLSARQSNG